MIFVTFTSIVKYFTVLRNSYSVRLTILSFILFNIDFHVSKIVKNELTVFVKKVCLYSIVVNPCDDLLSDALFASEEDCVHILLFFIPGLKDRPLDSVGVQHLDRTYQLCCSRSFNSKASDFEIGFNASHSKLKSFF